jgi:myo-inositol-1(or 4)-monophosphatase
MTDNLPDRRYFERLSRVAREAWRDSVANLSVQNKADLSYDPVTSADHSIEEALRSEISARFPDDCITGEELGDVNPGRRRRWSIDPIDGTRSLICHLSSWTSLVGLVVDGRPIAAMIDAPALDELLIAVDGVTTRNRATVRTSGVAQLGGARLSTTDPFLFDGTEFEAFNRVRTQVLITRYGLDALAYARVATGGLDLVIENGLKAHDYEALIPVIFGAGGHVGDWRGGEDFSAGRLVAAASRELYDEAVAVLAW